MARLKVECRAVDAGGGGSLALRQDQINNERPLRKAGTRGVPRPIREERILEVAGHVFAERGYHAASMDEIADLAGISKPMLYAYFSSKEGLYSEYVDRAGRELRERLRTSVSAETTAEERLVAAIDAFLGFVEGHRHAWAVLYSEAAAGGGPLAEEVTALRTQIVQEVRRLLEDSTDGTKGPPSASVAWDAVASAVVGAGESLANWWLWHPEVERASVAHWLFGVARAGLTQTSDDHPSDGDLPNSGEKSPDVALR
jgi:AcrR family transcriptional regulator